LLFFFYRFFQFWQSENLGNLSNLISSKDRSLLTYEFLTRTTYYSKNAHSLNKQHMNGPSEGNIGLERITGRYLKISSILFLFFFNTFFKLKGIERLIENGVFLAAYPLHEV
jgi:hypothetical protein